MHHTFKPLHKKGHLKDENTYQITLLSIYGKPNINVVDI